MADNKDDRCVYCFWGCGKHDPACPKHSDAGPEAEGYFNFGSQDGRGLVYNRKPTPPTILDHPAYLLGLNHGRYTRERWMEGC